MFHFIQCFHNYRLLTVCGLQFCLMETFCAAAYQLYSRGSKFSQWLCIWLILIAVWVLWLNVTWLHFVSASFNGQQGRFCFSNHFNRSLQSNSSFHYCLRLGWVPRLALPDSWCYTQSIKLYLKWFGVWSLTRAGLISCKCRYSLATSPPVKKICALKLKAAVLIAVICTGNRWPK